LRHLVVGWDLKLQVSARRFLSPVPSGGLVRVGSSPAMSPRTAPLSLGSRVTAVLKVHFLLKLPKVPYCQP
jgi:hypothetical protein